MLAEFQNLSAKSKNVLGLISAGLLIFSLMLGWNFLLSPTFRKTASLKQEKQIDQQKAALLGELAATEAKVSRYALIFSEKKDASWLIDTVSHAAEVSGIAVTSITPSQNEEAGDYTKTPIQIQLKGPYHSLGDFVSRIENDPHFIKVSHVSMGNTGANKKEATPNLGIAVLLYAFNPK